MVLYRDMRTYGFREAAYREAREKGVLFVRYEPEQPPQVGRQRPACGCGCASRRCGATWSSSRTWWCWPRRWCRGPTASELSDLLRVPLNADGFFLEAHMKLRPVDFASEGLFLCGTAHAPKFLSETISQANAVAARAASILSRKKMPVGGQIGLGRSGQVHFLHDLRARLPVHGAANQRRQQGRGAGGGVHGLRQLHGRVPGQGDHAAALRRRPDPGAPSTACWAADSKCRRREPVYPEQVGVAPPRWHKS